MGCHSCAHRVPPRGSSLLSRVDLPNSYSLSLPGSLKISPSLIAVCLGWYWSGNEAVTTELEEPTVTLPWGKEIKHISGWKFPAVLLLLWKDLHHGKHCSDSFYLFSHSTVMHYLQLLYQPQNESLIAQDSVRSQTFSPSFLFFSRETCPHPGCKCGLPATSVPWLQGSRR